MSIEPTHYPEGSLLRVTETHEIGTRPATKGTEFEVREYMPPLLTARSNEIAIAFYYGDANGGINNVMAAADKVELVKTAEQMLARRVPTVESIVEQLHCMDHYDGFRIDGADAPQGNKRLITGETDDGQPFSFYIQVTNVQENDF